MFSYVAKSLLSKTLRTFLRKYLENIELESIDYGNSSGSGWGVCLSNVKLREGMELMKLPGKRKRVVTRKKKVKRNKNSSATNDATTVTKNSTRIVNLDGGEESFVLQPRTRNRAAIVPEGKETSDTTEEKDGILLQPSKTLPLHEPIQNRDRFLTDPEDGYFSSNPPTPTQSNNLCGVHSTFCLNTNSKRYENSHEETAVSNDSITFDGDQLSNNNLFVDGEDDSGTHQFAEDNCRELDQNNQAEDLCLSSSSTTVGDGQFFSIDNSQDDGDAADDNSYIEVEEEVTIEDDMALVVGAGGAIGTLNIRLVGKELHVTVEDAHLIVEAIPEEVNADEPKNDETTKTPQPPKPNLDRSTSSSSEADLPSLADDDEGKTTIGEKIKKKSMLARYLSMIPHLFLRDCRVSIILPEETGDHSSTNDNCDECTVFEVGIDFLSVTSGDDFMDVLRFDTGNQTSEAEGAPIPKPNGFSRSSSVENETPSPGDNIFQRKRIRTGKGKESGIWLKVHPPHGKMMLPHHMKYPNKPKWARQRFLDSSESFFFRCSGIDLHARMMVDTKEDKVDEIGNRWSNEYEDYTMDSMLFGVDYVDPISLTRHSLPPPEKDVASDTDSNGIQSIPFASNFHWIAQGVHRSDCKSHLPLSDCFYCWDECVNQKLKPHSSMNNLMPLPGFIFCLSMADPLEINVDRGSLEALGYMKSLFTSKKPQLDEENDDTEQETDTHIVNEYANTTNPDLGRGNEVPINNVASTLGVEEKSFPPYMQPDAIYLSGLYVSKVVLRVEALTSRIDCGGKFRFWQFVGQSIHFEESQVDSEELFLRDGTFHIGCMECKDYTGVCERNLVVAGVDVGAIPAERQGRESKAHLPCTASRVLGVSSEKRLNESYAVHVRLIRSDAPKEVAVDESVSTTKSGYVDLRVGPIDLDIDNKISADISKVSNEARSIFTSGPKKAKKNNPKSKSDKKGTKWLFNVSTEGGTVSYQPRIKMKIPESNFRVRKGFEGFSFETYLQRLGIKYGSYTFEQKSEPPSIMPLCSLPESLRMHILVYLDDLTPLERVFNIKKKKSSAFLRIHAINKAIHKKLTHFSEIKTLSEKERVHHQTEVSRRNYAFKRLQSLDTDSLESLLSMHSDIPQKK
ncbi:hypothetical protein ACHAXR_011478 [Thalassiosira sp. AJA248-18]